MTLNILMTKRTSWPALIVPSCAGFAKRSPGATGARFSSFLLALPKPKNGEAANQGGLDEVSGGSGRPTAAAGRAAEGA